MDSVIRANKLRHITPAHLELFRGGMRLDAAWTKNRLDGFQPVPRWLMDKLIEHASDKAPQQPLFSLQKTHTARMLQDDLKRAGIPVFKAGEGKVVFHSLRMTYCSLLDYNGASAKETQELARHSTPVVTMNRYVRTRQDRVQQVVEEVGEVIKAAHEARPDPGWKNGQKDDSQTA